MLFQEIKDAIYTWASSNVTAQVIWAEQEGPRPERPYLTLKLITGPTKTMAIDNFKYDNDLTKFVLNGDRSVVLSINAFGNDAFDLLATLQNSLDDPTVIDELFENSLSILDDGDIRDVTLALETSFETRAVMEVTFGYAHKRETSVVDIQKVELEGDYGAIETNEIVEV